MLAGTDGDVELFLGGLECPGYVSDRFPLRYRDLRLHPVNCLRELAL